MIMDKLRGATPLVLGGVRLMRIRNVKPEFYRSDDIDRLPDLGEPTW